jgi:adenine-specific DNA-methyltransferase
MKKLSPNDPETQSADTVAGNIETLKTLFPEAFTEGHVDFEVLKQLLGAAVDERDEKYGLNWHGKRRARQLALTPSTGTLRPCPEDSVDWEKTQNLIIEGDNLEVLKLLQKSYAGKVKLIYIDPPYNTGRDFVYPDNFQDSIGGYQKLMGWRDDAGQKTDSLAKNSEASGRFHTDWLSMMYPRLKLARNLLRDDGVLFISIDDSEMHHLRVVADDIFGGENFIGQFIWKSKSGGANDSRHMAVDHEYVLIYGRNYERLDFGLDVDAEVTTNYNLKDDRGDYSLDRLDKQSLGYLESLDFPITGPDGKVYRVEHKNPAQKVARWRWGKSTVAERCDELVFKDGYVYTKNYKKDGAIARSLLIDERFGRTRTGKTELADLMGGQVFDNPKPSKLIQFFLAIASGNSDIVMDFFGGSGTTGHAVMVQNSVDECNRRFVLIQLPEPLDPSEKSQKAASDFCDSLKKPRSIAELTKERIRRAAKKIKDENPLFSGDLGFRVFKLDSSNIRAWEPKREDLPQTLLDAAEHLKAGRKEQDILYELLLKLGLDLTVPIEQKKISGKSVHSIGAGTLIVCLAEKVSREEVEPLAQGIVAWHKALPPSGDTTAVFRDSAFADDVAKTNLSAILQQHGIDNVRSI